MFGKFLGGFCLIWVILMVMAVVSTVVIVKTGGFADSKEFVIDGKKVLVEPYGIGNDYKKNDSIIYEPSMGNIALSVIFSETVVVPIYLVGWCLYEPIQKKPPVVKVVWIPSDNYLPSKKVTISSTKSN